MKYRSPQEKRDRRRRIVHAALILLALFIAVSLLDFPLLHLLTSVDPATGRVDRSFISADWYALLRVTGSLWTWSAVAIGFVLLDRSILRARPVFVAAVMSGLIAEVLKPILARERPINPDTELVDGWFYTFRAPLSGFFESSALGLPSSHAAVAFAGMGVISMMKPRLAPLAMSLALGCGVSRMITGAHFASDIFLGGVIGLLMAKRVMSRPRNNHHRKYMDP